MSDVVDLLTRIENKLDIDIPDEFYDEARDMDNEYENLEQDKRNVEDEKDDLENENTALSNRLDEIEEAESIVTALKEHADRQRWGLDFIDNYDDLIAEARR